MRSKISLWLFLFVVACGGLPPDGDIESLPEEDDPECENCTPQTPEDPIVPEDFLAVVPETLMFYADLSALSTMDHQYVNIVNNTSSPILIKQSEIVEDPKRVFSQHDALYFGLDNLLTNTVLDPDQSLRLGIHFMGDVKQRNAKLRIFTSHPNYPILEVQLQGKLFEDW